jgi:ATP-dependent exoDNAse (exonuclease V) alpha subunit
MAHLKNLSTDNLSLERTNKFNEALDHIENSTDSVFITGKAGTGKSTLLEYFANTTKKKYVALAPTGVAALNIKGQTIHSFFNFYIDITPEKIRKDYKVLYKKNIYKNLQMIIIDEVSMLRADLLDCIDTFLQIHGPNPDKPFGGIQMTFIGDLYQLPPVVSKNDHLLSLYKTPYFFSANALKSRKLKTIELDHVYRQKDQDFIDLLNKIRNNSITQQDIDYLNTRVENNGNYPNKTFICLTSTNQKADSINLERLNNIIAETFISEAQLEGDFTKDQYPTSTTLQLKVGAQIMLLNNDQKRRWVNGTLGTIKAISTDIHGIPSIIVELLCSQKLVSIYKHTWETFKFTFEGTEIISEKVGSFTQYPVRLAWAITIHKSQGKTFDNILVDLGTGSFAAGQTYVALSRCTSFSGISLLKHIKKTDIKTTSTIARFLEHQTET